MSKATKEWDIYEAVKAKCPYCKHWNYDIPIESQPSGVFRPREKCDNCEKIFRLIEKAED